MGASDRAPLDVARAQAVLRPDEIAVAFFLDEPNSVRWVMSHEHAVMDRVAGRAEIESSTTAELGELLFVGLTTAEGRPMVIIRDGALERVPFDALQVEGRPLGERHPLSYATSIDAFVQMRGSPTPPSSTAELWLAIALSLGALIVTAAKLRRSA